jgi:hypothetical protein
LTWRVSLFAFNSILPPFCLPTTIVKGLNKSNC